MSVDLSNESLLNESLLDVVRKPFKSSQKKYTELRKAAGYMRQKLSRWLRTTNATNLSGERLL